MQQYLIAFVVVQAIIILAAGWRATGACLALDVAAIGIAVAEAVRRRGLAGALRWAAVRLEAAAFAWERAVEGYRQWTRPNDGGPTGIEREFGR